MTANKKKIENKVDGNIKLTDVTHAISKTLSAIMKKTVIEVIPTVLSKFQRDKVDNEKINFFNTMDRGKPSEEIIQEIIINKMRKMLDDMITKDTHNAHDYIDTINDNNHINHHDVNNINDNEL